MIQLVFSIMQMLSAARCPELTMVSPLCGIEYSFFRVFGSTERPSLLLPPPWLSCRSELHSRPRNLCQHFSACTLSCWATRMIWQFEICSKGSRTIWNWKWQVRLWVFGLTTSSSFHGCKRKIFYARMKLSGKNFARMIVNFVSLRWPLWWM